MELQLERLAEEAARQLLWEVAASPDLGAPRVCLEAPLRAPERVVQREG